MTTDSEAREALSEAREALNGVAAALYVGGCYEAAACVTESRNAMVRRYKRETKASSTLPRDDAGREIREDSAR
jgi:hypothetical protein